MQSKTLLNCFFRMIKFVVIAVIIYSCGASKNGQKNEIATILPVDTIMIEIVDSVAIKLELKKKEIQQKYAAYLKTDPSELKNIRLYTFIDEWLGVPFLMGGTGKDGIDCSAFVQRLFIDVYQVQLPRTVIEQVKSDRIEPFSSSRYLAEGDIVFFQTIDKKFVSHVGVYLRNNMFINASTSAGVKISSLGSPYWGTAYVLAGRVKASFTINGKQQNLAYGK